MTNKFNQVFNRHPPAHEIPIPIESVIGRMDASESRAVYTEDGVYYYYHEITRYVVAAPGVCGGRATIAGTRHDIRHLVWHYQSGQSDEEIAASYMYRTVEEIADARALIEQNDPEIWEHPMLPARLIK